MKAFRDVNAYISSAAPEARKKLTELRWCLRSMLPQAEEKIWYGVPFYHWDGELVGFAAYAKHISVGLGASFFPQNRRKELERQGYRTARGTFQIRFDQEIPVAVLRSLLQEKIQFRKTGELKTKSKK